MDTGNLPKLITRANIRTTTGTVAEIAKYLAEHNLLQDYHWNRVKRLIAQITPIYIMEGQEQYEVRCAWDPDCQPQKGSGFWYRRTTAGPGPKITPWTPFNWNVDDNDLDTVSTYMKTLGETL